MSIAFKEQIVSGSQNFQSLCGPRAAHPTVIPEPTTPSAPPSKTPHRTEPVQVPPPAPLPQRTPQFAPDQEDPALPPARKSEPDPADVPVKWPPSPLRRFC
jgi:hypothetical protein